MDDTRLPVSRRRFVGMASALGALPVVGGASSAAAAARAAQEAGGEAFPNGINATSYVGGDGSYQKYLDDSLRLGLIEAFPVNFTDRNRQSHRLEHRHRAASAGARRDHERRVRRRPVGVDGTRTAERPLRSTGQ